MPDFVEHLTATPIGAHLDLRIRHMFRNLFTRRCPVLGRTVREPTLLTLGLTGVGLLVLLGAYLAAVSALPAFGIPWWISAAIAFVLAWLVLGLRRRGAPDAQPATGRLECFRRLLRSARVLFAGLLACWLGLIAWSEWSSAGPPPPPKDNSDLVRVLTWNIHCGQDDGPLRERFDWTVRKHALQAALEQARPDILCVQEARPEQVAFLERALPNHRRVGLGRDGPAAGEHCAIYFERGTFEEIDGGTFGLEGPAEGPRPLLTLDARRICTWVRLRDRRNGRVLRVYNTHLHLTEGPRRTAADLILAHVAAGAATDAVILTADFNAPPSSPSRRLFAEAGLADSAELAHKRVGAPTFHLYGVPLRCLDGILVGPGWRPYNHLVLDIKPNNTFPSDHFGVLADLAWQAP